MDYNTAHAYYKPKIEQQLEKFLDKKINEQRDDFLKFVYTVCKEQVMNGGKRLRPVIANVTNYMFSRNISAIVPALSVELFHNSTLIHDDPMDEDEKRRGKKTVYKVFYDHYMKENKIAQKSKIFKNKAYNYAVSNATLAGNIMRSLGHMCITNYQTIQPENIIKALKIYERAYKVVNEGQHLDINMENKDNITEQEYINMVRKKTGNLFKASAQIGAVLAGARPHQIKHIGFYAGDVGIAFQIRDDLMDLDRKCKKGHEVGSDIIQGKRTYPIIYAMQKNKEIKELLGKRRSVNKCIRLIEETGALDHSIKKAKEYANKAKQQLEKAFTNHERLRYGGQIEFLNTLADFMFNRKE